MGNAIGPDVSFYDDNPDTPEQIDFVKMKKSADFTIIRAGQNLWPDSDFAYNWADAKKTGLPRGSYWFYDSRADPKRQAELWVELMKDDLGELPLFADIEENYGGQYGGWRKWYDFLERLKELVGQKEIAIYTAFYYWRDNAPNATTEAQSLEYFHQYPLWIAHYGVTQPSIPKPWNANEWLFWQFTESGDGALYGVESKGFDLNYFNGDVEAFRQRFKITDTGGTPPGGGQETNEYRVELSIRENPGPDEKVIGILQQDEVLEVLDTTVDESWIQVKRSDGTTGWIYHEQLIKVESPAPPGNGNGNGEPPTTETKWYRVTAFALNVRSGPGTSYDDIGTLQQGEVVKALDYAVANSWIKIYRPSDGLTGWSSAGYLEETTAPPDSGTPPDGGTPPDNGGSPETKPPDAEWYRVTASTLNVREGPSTNDTVVGSLPANSVVKALAQTTDGSWIQILCEPDGLTGWCSVAYLEATDAPPPEAIPKNWYQVKVATLNVREGPSTSNNKVGTLSQGQIVVGLEANDDGSWVRVQRFDGLVGWCAVAYLTDLGTTVPEQLTQKIFNGVTYFRKTMQSPRKMVAHVLAVDTRTTGLKSLVTPPSNADGLMCTRKVSQFLTEFGLQVAVNGDGFKYLDQNTYDPQQYCPNGGEPVKVNSYAASRGTVYSQQWASRPIMYINKSNEVTFNEEKGAVYNAVSGDRMLVEKGKPVSNLESQSVEPRTAAGTNQNGRWLFLVVVDGRQPGYSEGITFPELADFLISQGIYTAINLDGGGSSAMVIESVLGGPFVLNSPIEGNIPGNASAVANHLGFWVNK
jgi:uncharacterized protein YgiM (DUF1202 family)/GH25 family lysozyme M1 (1,4-beta-N-acetylmuramidase)